jgi:hypothetical protein
MTPKLRLRDDERKALLSWILKLRWPGNLQMIRSTQIIDAPSMQAAKYQYHGVLSEERRTLPMPLRAVMIQPRVSLSIVMSDLYGEVMGPKSADKASSRGEAKSV